jgi:hypothetical protein
MARRKQTKLRISDIQSHEVIPGLEEVAVAVDATIEEAKGGESSEGYCVPDDIVQAIIDERVFQIEVKGYDDEHDDGHVEEAWVAIVGKHQGEYAYKIFDCRKKRIAKDPLQTAREGLVKIAAIAVAGIESLDRRKTKALEEMEKIST